MVRQPFKGIGTDNAIGTNGANGTNSTDSAAGGDVASVVCHRL